MLNLLSSCNLHACNDVYLFDLIFMQNSIFPYLFSFDEPWSISDLGLNYDIRAMVYGGNIGIWPSGIYVFSGIDGKTGKLEIWVLSI